MKALLFNRKRLLRAIHAAMVALFLAAQIAVRAQTATGDGHGDITITGSGGNTFFFSPTSTPPLAPGGTLTIASGANLTSSGAGAYGIEVHSPSTTTNSGYVSAFENTVPGNALYVGPLTSGDVTINNNATGTFSGISGDNYARGIYVQHLVSGSLMLNNSGLISGSNYLNLALGVYAQVDTGATTLTNTASGTITASTVSGNYGNAVYLVSNSGPITVSNAGTILGSGFIAPGIGLQTTSGGNISITNSGSVVAEVDQAAVVPGSCSLYGIVANQTGAGTLKIANTGTITADGTTSGSAYGMKLSSNSTGAITISNSGYMGANGGGRAYAIALNGTSTGDTTITNAATGTLSGISTSNSAYGIFIQQGGSATVTNKGMITASSSAAYDALGVYVSGQSGAAVMNTGTVSVTGNGTATALNVISANGTASVNNSGVLRAQSNSANYNAAGIYMLAGNGHAVVTNSGYIGAFSTTGHAFGVEFVLTRSATLNNSGVIGGTMAGVYSNFGPVTVNNRGVLAGMLYSVDLQSGSTVNLLGAASMQGLMKGGPDDTSTSVLNFNQTVPRNELAADKAALNAAIATYDSDLAAATKGPGNDVDSSLITIDGDNFQWEDFGAIFDHLTSGNRYGAFAGYHGIGSAIDNFNPNSAEAASILNALGNLPGSAVPSALAQLSPVSLQVLRNIAFDNADFTDGHVNDHLANLRDGLTGFDTSGFSINAPGSEPMLNSVRSHLLAWNPAPDAVGLVSDSPAALFGGGDAKDMKTMVTTQPVDRWSSFISGSVILADLDNTLSNTGGASYTTGSVMAGVDYRLDDHFTVGALFDYSHTGADLDGNGSKATVDSYAPGIYASYVDGPWYANGLVSYGFNSDTEDRAITIPGIAGDNHGVADGGQVTSDFTGGYEFRSGQFKYGPVASLQYVHLNVDSFQEDGPTALTTNRLDDDSLRSQLGFEVRYNALCRSDCGLITFTPHVQATWMHEYMDNSDGITASFNGTGGGSFVVQGEQPERDAAFIDVGLDAGVSSNVTLFIDYQAQAGQANFFGQSAQGGVRVGF